jgi:hypothetical protein
MAEFPYFIEPESDSIKGLILQSLNQTHPDYIWTLDMFDIYKGFNTKNGETFSITFKDYSSPINKSIFDHLISGPDHDQITFRGVRIKEDYTGVLQSLVENDGDYSYFDAKETLTAGSFYQVDGLADRKTFYSVIVREKKDHKLLIPREICELTEHRVGLIAPAFTAEVLEAVRTERHLSNVYLKAIHEQLRETMSTVDIARLLTSSDEKVASLMRTILSHLL